MRKLLLLITLICFNFSFSQNKIIDSLRTEIVNYKANDTVKIQKLLYFAKRIQRANYKEAETKLQEALLLSKELKSKKLESLSLTGLARVNLQRGKLTEAMEFGINSKKIADSLQNKTLIQEANVQLLSAYSNNMNYDQAKELAKENYNISKLNPNSRGHFRNLYYYAEAERMSKNFEGAEKRFKEGIELSKKANNKAGEYAFKTPLASLYKDHRKFDKAELVIDDIINYYEANNKARLAGPYFSKATLYSMQFKHQEAEPWYLKSLKIYEAQGNLFWKKRIAQILYVNYSIQQKNQLADSINKVYIAARDSIDSKEKKQIIEDVRIKYETDKIEQEKNYAKLESSKNRNLFIGSVIIGVLILMASLFYLGRIKAKKKAEVIALELKETQKRLALEKQYRDAELKALKAQMNPHFIFNALNSIQEYIVLNQKSLASDYLGKFADLIRNYLNYSDTGLISIPEEVHNLNLYLELEKLRFEDELSYSFNVEGKVNSELIKIPTMLIQPYIENALKHGLLHKRDNRILSVSISQYSSSLVQCIIEDNGVGRKKSEEIKSRLKPNHKSFALNANTQRLDLLNYGKERKIGVEIIDLMENDGPKGTKVILTIPIIKS